MIPIKGVALILSFFFLSVSYAEDSVVSENTKNSFQPDQFEPVTISEASKTLGTKNINWKKDPKVIVKKFGTNATLALQAEGVLAKKDPQNWTLLCNTKHIDVKDDGAFTLNLPINRTTSHLECISIGPNGQAEHSNYTLGLKPVEKPTVPVGPMKRFFLTPGLGFTSISYKQDSISYSSLALTAKVSANYLLFPPNWDIGFNAYITALNLTKSQPLSVRYLGSNLRIGYIFPQLKDPWRLTVYGGYYFTTMFVTGNTFGFQDMSGPQIYPALRRTFKNGHAITGYVKYSPVSNQLRILKLSNRELAAGLAYIIPTSKRSFSISFDYANLSLALDSLTSLTQTYTLGVGMTF